jgi:hypothetical protein
MMEFVECPEGECSAIAYVAEHYTMESTAGPLDMVRVGCVVGHRLNCPASYLKAAS